MGITIRNTKTHRSIVLALLTFPIMAIPIIFYEIYRKNYYALYYLAFVMSLLAFLWVPSGDLYRYTEDYNYLKTLTFEEFWDEIKFDFILQSLMYGFAKLGLEFQWFRFTTCFVSYLLIFSIFKDAIKRSTFDARRSTVFMLFIVLFCLLRFSVFSTGVRFTFGMALCFYGYYHWYLDRKVGWLFLIMAGFTHFSFWVIVVLALFSKLLRFPINRIVFGIGLVTLFFVTNMLLVEVINILPIDDLLKKHIENYTTGYYADGELHNHSFFFRLSQIFSICALYVIIIISFIRLKKFDDYRLYAFMLILLVLMWNMNSAFNRYAFLTIMFFSLVFVINPHRRFKRSDLKILFLISLFVYSISIYSVKRELVVGKQKSLFYMPAPFAFTNIYTPQWIDENISKNGGFLKDY